MGCVIPNGRDDCLFVVVDRYERPDGRVVRKDTWSARRIVPVSQVSSVESVVSASMSWAKKTKYSNDPPDTIPMQFVMSPDMYPK